MYHGNLRISLSIRVTLSPQGCKFTLTHRLCSWTMSSVNKFSMANSFFRVLVFVEEQGQVRQAIPAQFYKSTATGAMAGGLKDFGGTTELGGPKCKNEQTAGGTKN